MIYIIDAYNVIHAVKPFEKKLDESLQAARSGLISFCAKFQMSRGDIEQIVLVFDGSSHVPFQEKSESPGVKLIFTETHEDADDRIVDILHSLKPKNGVTVVSSDNYVRNHARSCSADRLSPQDFYAMIARVKNGVRAGVKKPAEGKMYGKHADKITAEYKKHLGIE